jgi:hypothetical protein
MRQCISRRSTTRRFGKGHNPEVARGCVRPGGGARGGLVQHQIHLACGWSQRQAFSKARSVSSVLAPAAACSLRCLGQQLAQQCRVPATRPRQPFCVLPQQSLGPVRRPALLEPARDEGRTSWLLRGSVPHAHVPRLPFPTPCEPDLVGERKLCCSARRPTHPRADNLCMLHRPTRKKRIGTGSSSFKAKVGRLSTRNSLTLPRACISHLDGL